VEPNRDEMMARRVAPGCCKRRERGS
jgi:hypothetical protein